MLRPRIPTNPLPTGIVTGTARNDVPAVPHQSPAPMSATPAPVRPTVQLTPGAVVAAIGGVTVVVLVVGAVLVSMLLAVAAASLAISALIVRSLVASQNHR
ncbi:SpdD-like protein [Streptomyces microflavus]|uniref:SpdD-like protein n=1 Tax=Streptomyces microflavus TaxID=1919 RepID=UPI002E11D700|nr:SpdD-like protein [Streptomyces microflavus]